MGETACKLQQKNVGANVQGATRVHVPEAHEGRWSSAFSDHAVGGHVGSDDVRARRGCEDSRYVEDVGVAGKISERCEGTDVDEIGGDRQEL